MPVAVTCPGCGGSFRVPDAAAGKRFKCKACGAAITVPDATGLEELPAMDEPERPPAAPAAAAKAQPPAVWTQRWRARIGGTGAGFALRVALLAWTFLMLLVVLAWLSSLQDPGGAAGWASKKRGVVVWSGVFMWLLPAIPLGLAAIASALRQRGALQRWRGRAGPRSYILQLALLGWTAFILSVTVLWMVAIVAHGFGVRSGTRMDVAAAAAGVVACWGFGLWLLAALPLGIAAVATLAKEPAAKPDGAAQ